MFRTKQQLKEEIIDAETRAITHFKKLYEIEQIINQSDQNKELYVTTIEKIKKVIQ